MEGAYSSVCVHLVFSLLIIAVNSSLVVDRISLHFSQTLHGIKYSDIIFLLGITDLQQLIFLFFRLLNKSGDEKKNYLYEGYVHVTLPFSSSVWQSQKSLSYLKLHVTCSTRTCPCHMYSNSYRTTHKLLYQHVCASWELAVWNLAFLWNILLLHPQSDIQTRHNILSRHHSAHQKYTLVCFCHRLGHYCQQHWLLENWR